MKTTKSSPEKLCDEKILDEIKEDYLNGETKTLLYKKYGLKYNIDKFSFIKIMNSINNELGFKSKTKKIKNDIDWNIDSKMQMNIEPEYANSTYANK